MDSFLGAEWCPTAEWVGTGTYRDDGKRSEMEKRLYVGNLSYGSTESDVQELFEQAGRVVSCELVLDKFTSRSRGFAFVEMGTEDEAQKAVEMFNEYELQGRPLRVNIARPREERSPRRDRGGYGGGRGGYGGGNRY